MNRSPCYFEIAFRNARFVALFRQPVVSFEARSAWRNAQIENCVVIVKPNVGVKIVTSEKWKTLSTFVNFSSSYTHQK